MNSPMIESYEIPTYNPFDIPDDFIDQEWDDYYEEEFPFYDYDDFDDDLDEEESGDEKW